MLNSTFDLITLATAASNSLVAFCFCNLIIVILLLGSSKPSSDIHQEISDTEKRVIMDNSFNPDHSFNTNGRASTDDRFLEESSFVDDETMINNGEESPYGDDENGNEGDDELRRRVEEFIDKVNRGWKAEKLRMQMIHHAIDNKFSQS
ncbi:hypothetical protein ACH5RR_019598 [Cinchona calisaya]|uniref:Uncharacterized protein n=1 Tax=Cinchona calisaya TaxID=153742 RepID=A0ABD2ZQR1_9GENT